MGISGLWPHVVEKGYLAPVLYAPQAALAKLKEGTKQHVDVLGSIYSTIRHAYSTSTISDEKAHSIVEQRPRQFASPSTSILYLDGEPAQEKEDTHQARAEIRSKALAATAKSAARLLDLVQNGQRVRKQHFAAVEDNLRKVFEWSPAHDRSSPSTCDPDTGMSSNALQK